MRIARRCRSKRSTLGCRDSRPTVETALADDPRGVTRASGRLRGAPPACRRPQRGCVGSQTAPTRGLGLADPLVGTMADAPRAGSCGRSAPRPRPRGWCAVGERGVSPLGCRQPHSPRLMDAWTTTAGQQGDDGTSGVDCRPSAPRAAGQLRARGHAVISRPIPASAPPEGRIDSAPRECPGWTAAVPRRRCASGEQLM